jgi:hypothetical protein
MDSMIVPAAFGGLYGGGEQLARFAYNYQFNPGGSFTEQGDAVM